MIDKEYINKLLDQALEDEDFFPVIVNVKPGNIISVFLDGANGVSIGDCARVSRYIKGQLLEDEEDFSLEVSSYGVGKALLLPIQFKINIGRIVKTMLHDSTTYKGEIKTATDEYFELELVKKAKKKSENTIEIIKLKYDECRESKITVSFK